MSTPLTQYNSFKIPEKKGAKTDIVGFIRRCFYHWPLFAIGLGLSTYGLVVFLKSFKPVYEIKATLLLLDDKKIPNQIAPLQEIDRIGNARLIENEIEVFKSKQLIDQVVRDLDLSVVYEKRSGEAWADIYNQTPVKFELIRATGQYDNAVVNIVVKDAKSFYIVGGDGSSREFFYKDTFQSRFGTWKLEPTDELATNAGADIKITIRDPESVALAYQNLIGANLSNKLSTALVLSVDDPIPQRGKDILNKLISNYDLAANAVKNLQIKSTIDFLDKRIASLATELTSAEKGIEKYKSQRGITDINVDSKINLEGMQKNDVRLNEVSVQLGVVEEIEKYINSDGGLEEAPSTFGVEDPTLNALIGGLSALQLERDKLLATTPATNPAFEKINRQINTTKASIRKNVKNIKTSLSSSKRKLDLIDGQFRSRIRRMPTKEREFIDIKRQQGIKENLYTYLLQKREEIAVTYASSLNKNRLIEAAYSGAPKGNTKPIALAMAMLLGLGIPAGLILVRSFLRQRVISKHEIHDALDIPIIIEIPFEGHKKPIVFGENGPTAITEQFRGLRIRLHHIFSNRQSGRVTLITSSVPGEGKSFISANLSVALACSGRKTVVLELDLRRPRMAYTLKVDANKPGVSNYLKDQIALNDIIQHSNDFPGLDVITSGYMIENPSELLESAYMNELIEKLRAHYDDIIIDSPPLHLVPDALILFRLADAILYTIRQGFTAKSELNFIRDLQDQRQAENLHIVFNGIQGGKYGYGYAFDKNYYKGKKRYNLAAALNGLSDRF